MDRKEEFLKPGERLDDLQNGYWMIQNPSLFCYGIDAVLLASYAKVKRRERAMDFCTGSGIVPILLKAKTNGEHFSGLEIQEYSAEMAQRSVRYNHLENEVEIFQGDVKTASQQFGKEVFDVVTCNPPYMTGQHEVLCSFDDIAKEASAVLKTKGRFYLVHRPFRLAEIFSTLKKYHLEPKRMQLVYPFVDKEPNMVLIEAMKGGNPRITVEKPLIVYETPGVYTKDIRELYGDGR